MNYPIKTKITVAWGDMDAFGHVNNVMYLRYFETARAKFFEEFANLLSGKEKVGPVLASVTCDYKRPVVFPDELSIHLGIKKLGNASVVMACEMYSAKVGLAATAECTLVMFDFVDKRPVGLPKVFREYLQEIQQKVEA